MDAEMRRLIARYVQSISGEHAPLRDGVAFRCEPHDLYNSAAHIWGYSTQVEDMELVKQLTNHAEWYEDMARDMQAIRSLPEP